MSIIWSSKTQTPDPDRLQTQRYRKPFRAVLVGRDLPAEVIWPDMREFTVVSDLMFANILVVGSSSFSVLL
jgi:hypothetical protein